VPTQAQLRASARRPASVISQARNFDLVRAHDHALGARAREPGVHQLDQIGGRKAVRAQDTFGAAFGATAGEQFERADAVGLGMAARAGALETTRKVNREPNSAMDFSARAAE